MQACMELRGNELETGGVRERLCRILSESRQVNFGLFSLETDVIIPIIGLKRFAAIRTEAKAILNERLGKDGTEAKLRAQGGGQSEMELAGKRGQKVLAMNTETSRHSSRSYLTRSCPTSLTLTAAD